MTICRLLLSLVVLVLAVAAGVLLSASDPAAAQTPWNGQCVPKQRVRFAVVGDFGVCANSPDYCEAESAVAAYLTGINPDFIVTTGDNNYEDGLPGSNNEYLERNIRRAQPPNSPSSPDSFPLYESFVPGRFFAAMGNHDWRHQNADPTRPFQGIGGPRQLRVGNVELFLVETIEIYAPGTCQDDCDSGIGSAGGPNFETLDQQRAILAPLIAACRQLATRCFTCMPPRTRTARMGRSRSRPTSSGRSSSNSIRTPGATRSTPCSLVTTTSFSTARR